MTVSAAGMRGQGWDEERNPRNLLLSSPPCPQIESFLGNFLINSGPSRSLVDVHFTGLRSPLSASVVSSSGKMRNALEQT